MYNNNPEIDTLMTEFQDVTQQLELVLKDLEWRKPDVEREEKLLKALKKKAKEDPGVDVASQAIVVRVGREILNDKIKEANRLEKRMNELKEQLGKLEAEEGAGVGLEVLIAGEEEEKAEAAVEKPEEGEEAGEAVPQETH